MAITAKPETFTSGTAIVASEHNSNFDAIFNDYNGNVTDANCAAAMSLALSKLDLSDDATFTGDLTLSGTTSLTGAANLTDANIIANSGLALAQGTAPSTSATEVKLYAKDTSGEAEAFIRKESDGTEVQVTTGGALVGGATSDFVVKAWANITWSAGTPTLQDSYNVDTAQGTGGIDDDGVGLVTIYWDTDFASVNYACTGTAADADSDASVGIKAQAVGSAQFAIFGPGGSRLDPDVSLSIIAIGDQ